MVRTSPCGTASSSATRRRVATAAACTWRPTPRSSRSTPRRSRTTTCSARNDTDGRGNSIAVEQSSATVRVLNSTIDEPLTNNSAIYGTFTETGTPNLEILSSTIVSGNHGLEMDPNSPTSRSPTRSSCRHPGASTSSVPDRVECDAHAVLRAVRPAADHRRVDRPVRDRGHEAGRPRQQRWSYPDASAGAGQPSDQLRHNAAAYLATTPDDQRGPGFPRILNGRIDAGAVEVQAASAGAPARRCRSGCRCAGGLVLLAGRRRGRVLGGGTRAAGHRLITSALLPPHSCSGSSGVDRPGSRPSCAARATDVAPKRRAPRRAPCRGAPRRPSRWAAPAGGCRCAAAATARRR